MPKITALPTGSNATGTEPIPAVQGGATVQLTPNKIMAARTITSGAGLTGGGTLETDKTLEVGAGTGISVGENDVGLDTSHARNVDHSAVSITAGAGLTGGGTLEATRDIAVGAGTGIAVNANDVALAINSLTEDTDPDLSADFWGGYDTSASTHKKVAPNSVFKKYGIFNILAYGAVGDAKIVTDGVITASSTTLTSATASFTSADTGKTLIVEHADSIASGTCTFDHTNDQFLRNSHGGQINEPVVFTNSGGALPPELTANTVYFIRDETANNGKLATSRGGPVINLTGNGTGTHTMWRLRPLETTITFVNSTTVTMGATSAVTGTGRNVLYGTNNKTAINNAIDAAQTAGGGTVLVPCLPFMAIDIDLTHRNGIWFKGVVWGVNDVTINKGIGRGSVLLPIQSSSQPFLDCTGSTQLRVSDLQIGCSNSPVDKTYAILVADSDSKAGDCYEFRNLFVVGKWSATPIYDFGAAIDARHCRFWNYRGTTSTYATMLTRDNTFTAVSAYRTISTGTGNPNSTFEDCEFHNFTGLATPNGAVYCGGALFPSFKHCLFDSSTTTKGTIEFNVANSTHNIISLYDCTLYSESTGPIDNAYNLWCISDLTLYGYGNNQYTNGTAKKGGAGTLTYGAMES